MANQTLVKYREAIAKDPTIVVSKENVRTHQGCTPEQLEALGLGKKELLRLSRLGLALKAHTTNIFPPKEDEENAWAEVPVVYYDEFVDSRGYERRTKRIEIERRPRYWYRGKGMRTRWILLAEGS